MYALFMYVYLCRRWVWACMRLHRLECTRACDCARRRCGRRHHVRAWVRPPVYIVNAHVMYNIYNICIYRCKVRACTWVRVCVLAYACDRVRALTMREYAACVRVRRALFVRPSIDGTRTGMVYIHMMNACIYIHAGLATQMGGSPMRGPLHTCAHVLRPSARACACAIGRPRIRAGTCERLPSASIAGGSARRRSDTRRRSTRTSALGTLPLSRRCSRYAPLSAGARRGRDSL
jgi:hypothetical protein